MPLAPPTTLSPSKVASFTECALAFKFSAIDRLPEPPSIPATRGTLVHAALERLFCLPAEGRTPQAAMVELAEAAEELRTDPEFVALDLDAEAEAVFFAEAEELVLRYFQIEDPTTVNPIGIELQLAVEVGGLTLRGIIDRLELDADGELVVTDYKTGRAPAPQYEQRRLSGVHFYAFLCEQLFGKRPAKVQLLYLQEPTAIVCTPSAQSARGLQTRVEAIWTAVTRACERDDFRPRPGRLCGWCSFRPICPAFAGESTGTGHQAPVPVELSTVSVPA